jgi:tripartite-type tricarboxylate transporter receptor subunit TctC
VSADSLSHIVAAALSVSLGVLVIVDAKPGAGGNIASEFVSRATPDGYTITLRTGGHAVSAALYKKLRFHPVDSFDFISLTGTFPFVVATRNDGPIASGEGAFTDHFPQRSLKFRARQGQLLAAKRSLSQFNMSVIP